MSATSDRPESPLREGFDPFDPATWTPEERSCYALGYGEADNGLRARIDDEAPEGG